MIIINKIIKFTSVCEAEKLSWTVGDPAASLEIKGGNHAAFPTRNLNNDPETFWHSGNNKKYYFVNIEKIIFYLQFSNREMFIVQKLELEVE